MTRTRGWNRCADRLVARAAAKIASFDILAPRPSKSVSAKVTEATYVSTYSNCQLLFALAV